MNFHQQLDILREAIRNFPLTPNQVEITLKTKLNSVKFKPLFSNGGVAPLPNSRYDILLNDTLKGKEIRRVFVHELVHVHYSEVSPVPRDEEEYESLEGLIKPETHRFLQAHPDYISQLEQRYLLLPNI